MSTPGWEATVIIRKHSLHQCEKPTLWDRRGWKKGSTIKCRQCGVVWELIRMPAWPVLTWNRKGKPLSWLLPRTCSGR